MRQLVHAVLHRAFVQAERWEIVARNPCDAVDRPRVPRREISILNPAEVQQLLKAAHEDRLEVLYVVAVASGARQGELLGLRWQDVDPSQGLISVRRTLVEVGGRLELSEPKTARSRRRIDLPDFALEALLRHREQLRAAAVPSDLVFTDTRGDPIRKQNLLRRSWRPLLARAGLPQIPFHALRHTHASLLLAASVHPKSFNAREI